MAKLDEQFPYRVTISRWYELEHHRDIMGWCIDQFGIDNSGITWRPALTGSPHVTDRDFSTWLFSNQQDATVFNLTWNGKGPRTLIDPPGGWKWGFPKPIPDDQMDRIEEWLVENGYPKSEILMFTKYGGNVPYRIIPE